MKSQAPNENANAKRQFVVSEGANAVSVHKRPQAPTSAESKEKGGPPCVLGAAFLFLSRRIVLEAPLNLKHVGLAFISSRGQLLLRAEAGPEFLHSNRRILFLSFDHSGS